VVVEIDPLSLGADYWDQNRHVPFTAKENAIYHMVDTMKTIPRFRTYVDIISTVVTGYYEKGKVELGPYFTTLSYNPVEGARFRLGGRTSNNFSTWVEFEGYSAYGVQDERFKFGLFTRGFISKQPRLLYRAGYKHDVEQLGQSTECVPQRQPPRQSFRRSPNTKLTDVEEWRVSLEREWFTGFTNEVKLRYRTLQALGNLRYERVQLEPEPDARQCRQHPHSRDQFEHPLRLRGEVRERRVRSRRRGHQQVSHAGIALRLWHAEFPEQRLRIHQGRWTDLSALAVGRFQVGRARRSKVERSMEHCLIRCCSSTAATRPTIWTTPHSTP
jgi:hypothetical protein